MSTELIKRISAIASGIVFAIPLFAFGLDADFPPISDMSHASATYGELVVSTEPGPNPSTVPTQSQPASSTTKSSGPTDEAPKSTSDTRPKIIPFAKKVKPVRDYPRVASKGECAPKYANGTRGACIQEKPCRGYGIKNDKNEVLCMCYLTHGGCDTKSRCDVRAHACVPDTKEPDNIE